MELIRLLINSVNNSICFLCFKESDNIQNIFCKLEIKNQYYSGSLSVADIVNCLFPSFELILSQACYDCVDLFIRMYLSLQRYNVMKQIIKNIINSFNKEININSTKNLDSVAKYQININLSQIVNITECNTSGKKNEIDHSLSNESELCDDKTDIKDEENIIREKQCPDCFKIFNNIKQFKSHLKNHNRKHRKIYHSCHYCDYKSLCKESLNGHINKNHLNTKPFFCKVCYKSYYHKKNLVEHETIHRQERNDICEYCGEMFIHKKNLLEHLKLHSGYKPFGCEICGLKFVTSGRRLEHIQRKHGEKNKCCLHCGKKFGLNKELTRHLKTVHSE